MTRGPITLLTDFATADGYVAAMKGVIASIAPDVRVDDVAHDIAPGDVMGAALALKRYWRLYPQGSIHVVVVDPGVGSERRGIAIEADARFCVGPDNGVFTHVLRDAVRAQVVSLESREFFRETVAATFHGRDMFAPVAAHLASNVSLSGLGPIVGDPVRLDWPEPRRASDGSVEGVVVHVDRFGNLITNIPADWCARGGSVAVNGRDIGAVRRTYADVARGEALALIGSLELLEISVRDGSAAAILGAGRDARVRVTMCSA
jgi:S-adenosylmethionine hydrolase